MFKLFAKLCGKREREWMAWILLDNGTGVFSTEELYFDFFRHSIWCASLVFLPDQFSCYGIPKKLIDIYSPKNPKIHPDPYTQGSYLQKKTTWSLYTGFSSPCKLSRNPALCFSFPTLLTSSIIVITITIIFKPSTVLKIHHSAINASLLLIRDYRKES